MCELILEHTVLQSRSSTNTTINDPSASLSPSKDESLLVHSRKLRLHCWRSCEPDGRTGISIAGTEHSAWRNLQCQQWHPIQFGGNDPNTFISVQALYITPDDTLWVLDTGRPAINEPQAPSMPYAVPGGRKLDAINLSNNSIARTYTPPPTATTPTRT